MEKFIKDLFTEEILNEAISKYELDKDSIKQLGGFESFIYSFKAQDKDYILRITHNSRRSPEMIESEMHWIDFLHQNGINCALPYLTKDNKLQDIIGKDESSFIVCAFDKVPGNHLGKETDTEELRFQYGKQLGKMHAKTKRYQPHQHKRIEWFEDELIKNFHKIIPAEHTKLHEKFDLHLNEIHSIPKHQDNYGLVHYDAHPGNFFVENNQIYLFDFDDCQYAHFISDIAIVLFYFTPNSLSDSEKDRLISEFFLTFMKGYISENALSDEEIRHIPLFLKQREFILYAAILSAYGDESHFDPWAKRYMDGRREKLEKNIPFLNADFCSLYATLNH